MINHHIFIHSFYTSFNYRDLESPMTTMPATQLVNGALVGLVGDGSPSPSSPMLATQQIVELSPPRTVPDTQLVSPFFILSSGYMYPPSIIYLIDALPPLSGSQP